MNKVIAMLVALLAAAPLAAQEEPQPEPKVEVREIRKSKVIKIENGKVIELGGEDAEAEIDRMRKEVEDLRREFEEKLKRVRLPGGRKAIELPEGMEDAFENLPKEVRKRMQEAMERARKAAKEAEEQAGGGDVDIEIEESSEDGSSQVKIRIVRKTSRSEGGKPAESPLETPTPERKQ